MFCQNPTLNVNEPLQNNSLQLFPVPANDQLNISGLNPVATNTIIRVMDLSGRTVMEEIHTVNGGTVQLNISALAAGTYILQVLSDGNAAEEKFTVQK